MYVANPRALERFRPFARPGNFLDNFAITCPVHGEIATGMLTFDAAAIAFASHALDFHIEDDVQLEISWDDNPIPGDDYCI